MTSPQANGAILRRFEAFGPSRPVTVPRFPRQKRGKHGSFPLYAVYAGRDAAAYRVPATMGGAHGCIPPWWRKGHISRPVRGAGPIAAPDSALSYSIPPTTISSGPFCPLGANACISPTTFAGIGTALPRCRPQVPRPLPEVAAPALRTPPRYARRPQAPVPYALSGIIGLLPSPALGISSPSPPAPWPGGVPQSAGTALCRSGPFSGPSTAMSHTACAKVLSASHRGVRRPRQEVLPPLWPQRVPRTVLPRAPQDIIDANGSFGVRSGPVPVLSPSRTSRHLQDDSPSARALPRQPPARSRLWTAFPSLIDFSRRTVSVPVFPMHVRFPMASRTAHAARFVPVTAGMAISCRMLAAVPRISPGYASHGFRAPVRYRNISPPDSLPAVTAWRPRPDRTAFPLRPDPSAIRAPFNHPVFPSAHGGPELEEFPVGGIVSRRAVCLCRRDRLRVGEPEGPRYPLPARPIPTAGTMRGTPAYNPIPTASRSLCIRGRALPWDHLPAGVRSIDAYPGPRRRAARHPPVPSKRAPISQFFVCAGSAQARCACRPSAIPFSPPYRKACEPRGPVRPRARAAWKCQPAPFRGQVPRCLSRSGPTASASRCSRPTGWTMARAHTAPFRRSSTGYPPCAHRRLQTAGKCRQNLDSPPRQTPIPPRPPRRLYNL